jgi:hypothetical protein
MNAAAAPLHASSSRSPKSILRSHCHCRSVVLDISLPLQESSPRVVNCHCRTCRRFHTTAYTSYLVLHPVRDDDTTPLVSVRRGDDAIGRFQSACDEYGENTVERWYCKRCSSKLISVAKSTSSSMEPSSFLGDTYLVNLGPLDENTIPKEVCDDWKIHLIQSDSNLQRSQASRWHEALPAIGSTRMPARQPIQPATTTWTGGCL